MSYYTIYLLSSIPYSATIGLGFALLSQKRGRWLFILWASIYLTFFQFFFERVLQWETIFPGMLVAYILLGVLLGSGKLHIRALLGLFMMILASISELLTAVTFSFVHPSMDMMQAQADLVLFLPFKGLVALLNAFVVLVFCLIWRSCVQKRQDVNLGLYSIFPLSQFLLISIAYLVLYKNYPISSFVWLIAIVVVVGTISELCLFYAIRQLMRQQELAQQRQLLQQQLEVQQRYYSHLTNSIEKAAKLRHDMNNQLQTAFALFAEGGKDSADDLLKTLSDTIKRSTATVFCPNHIIDAVLLEKSRAAQAAAIEMQVEINLPADIPVEATQLCSVFANLLDNALNACQQLEPEQKPFIKVKSHITANVLTLHVVNSALAPSSPIKRPTADLPTHGLGLEIVRDVAQAYGGKLETAYSDGVYNAKLFLLLPESATV